MALLRAEHWAALKASMMADLMALLMAPRSVVSKEVMRAGSMAGWKECCWNLYLAEQMENPTKKMEQHNKH